MVYGMVAWQEGNGIIMDDIHWIGWWEVSMRCYRHYLLIYCLCGIVGPWVKVHKALEEDTPMWVYGVGPPTGVLKDTRLVLPLGMSPKRHGVWLALGWCPRIVIIILIILWNMDIWCVDCWDSAVYQLCKDGWRKARIKTHAYMFVMITHLLTVIKCSSSMLLNV